MSEFYGLSIYVYYADHEPPHFPAIHAGSEAVVAMETGEVVHGHLPRRARALVAEWAGAYRGELLRDWRLAREHCELERIPPLE